MRRAGVLTQMTYPYESGDPASPTAPRGRRVWPWVLLGGVVVTLVLAFVLYPGWLVATG